MIDAPPQTPRVPVIEDDPTVAELVERYLSREDYLVAASPDGRSGLRTALESRPDLVVLDLTLPGLSGAEVLAELRKTQGLVQAHAGRIEVSNEPGGCRFTVTIPMRNT